MNLKTFLAATAAATTLLVGVPASAAVVLLNDTLTTGPTFNRPVNMTTLSGVGTAVYYDINTFTVDTSGSYLIRLTAGYDTFALLYQGLFTPSSPLTNLIALNDDYLGVIADGSGFTVALTTGASYSFVETSFANGVTGPYTLTFTGPGSPSIGTQVGAVPEPESLALFGIALAGLCAVGRRKNIASRLA